VAGHPRGVAGVKSAQRRAHRLVQVSRVGPLGDLRAGGNRRSALTAACRALPSLRTPAAVVAGTAVPPVATLPTRTRLTGRVVGSRPAGTLRTLLPPVGGDVRPLAPRPVAPACALTLRPVPCRAPVLPAVSGRSLALRTALLPATAVISPGLTLRTTVPPLRTASARGVPLRTTALPLTPRCAAVPLRAPLLPLPSRFAGSGSAVAVRAPLLPLPPGCAAGRTAVLVGTTLPPLRALSRRTVTSRTPVLRTGAVPARRDTLRTAVAPLGTTSCGAVGLRTPLLPLATRTASSAAVPLRTPLLPVAATAPAAGVALGSSLPPLAVGTTLLPAPTPGVGRAATLSTPLPRPLTAAARGAPAGTGTLPLRTALPGAATAPSR
jgi:hypothetical protein